MRGAHVRPSLSAARWHRTIQAIALLLFLYLFLYVGWPYTATPSETAVITTAQGRAVPAHYVLDLLDKQYLPADTFLRLDPLLSVATALASRTAMAALWGAALTALVCLLVPRAFCSYICPLGTLIDLSDRLLKHRTGRPAPGAQRGIRFAVLIAVLVAAALGVMVAGYVAAIPVLTRGLAVTLGPVQLGLARDWHNVPAPGTGGIAAMLLLFAILALGSRGPRFWCRHVCPSGALLSLVSLLRVRERRLGTACIGCGKCIKVCPFDAIHPDFSTRTVACTFCRSCSAVCPVNAITFEPRTVAFPRAAGAGPRVDYPLTRRGFLGALAAGCGSALATGNLFGRSTVDPPIRPPGSVPEAEFLRRCIRCGECLRACPNVLQAATLEGGPQELWAPRAVPDWSGCDPSCANCGLVCPTGAIRRLPLLEKRSARMGTAAINRTTCLPWSGSTECQLCVDECRTAGYDAIEFERVRVEVDDDGFPIEGSGMLAPVMLAEKCVGCGLCQTRCYKINALQKRLLRGSAIRVSAGPTREDRMTQGSYLALRAAEQRQRLLDSRRREAELLAP